MKNSCNYCNLNLPPIYVINFNGIYCIDAGAYGSMSGAVIFAIWFDETADLVSDSYKTCSDHLNYVSYVKNDTKGLINTIQSGMATFLCNWLA